MDFTILYLSLFIFNIRPILNRATPKECVFIGKERTVCLRAKKQLCIRTLQQHNYSLTHDKWKPSLQRSDFWKVEHHTTPNFPGRQTGKTLLSSGTDTVKNGCNHSHVCHSCVMSHLRSFQYRKRNFKFFCNKTFTVLITHVEDHKSF